MTLALGIAAFCLVAIFSLLPVGLRGNLESSEETIATGVLSQVAADLRACPVTAPRGQAATTELFQIAIPANPVATAFAAPTRFFGECSYDGLTISPQSRYRVDMTFLTNGSTNTATLVYLKATWPAAAANPLGKVETFIALDRN